MQDLPHLGVGVPVPHPRPLVGKQQLSHLRARHGDRGGAAGRMFWRRCHVSGNKDYLELMWVYLTSPPFHQEPSKTPPPPPSLGTRELDRPQSLQLSDEVSESELPPPNLDVQRVSNRLTEKIEATAWTRQPHVFLGFGGSDSFLFLRGGGC